MHLDPDVYPFNFPPSLPASSPLPFSPSPSSPPLSSLPLPTHTHVCIIFSIQTNLYWPFALGYHTGSISLGL